MAIAGDRPPRYGNIETWMAHQQEKIETGRQKLRPGGLSYKEAIEL